MSNGRRFNRRFLSIWIVLINQTDTFAISINNKSIICVLNMTLSLRYSIRCFCVTVFLVFFKVVVFTFVMLPHLLVGSCLLSSSPCLVWSSVVSFLFFPILPCDVPLSLFVCSRGYVPVCHRFFWSLSFSLSFPLRSLVPAYPSA